MTTFGQFYDRVYSRDNQPGDDAHGWIQWKGTKVCVDLYCVCGELSHIDGDFFYFFRCTACNRKYAVGQNIRLIELDADEIHYVEEVRKQEFKEPSRDRG